MSQTIIMTEEQLAKLIRHTPSQVWLSSKEFASRVGCTDKHIWKLVAEGKIKEPSYSLGKRSPRWHIDYIDAFVGGYKNESNI